MTNGEFLSVLGYLRFCYITYIVFGYYFKMQFDFQLSTM